MNSIQFLEISLDISIEVIVATFVIFMTIDFFSGIIKLAVTSFCTVPNSDISTDNNLEFSQVQSTTAELSSLSIIFQEISDPWESIEVEQIQALSQDNPINNIIYLPLLTSAMEPLISSKAIPPSKKTARPSTTSEPKRRGRPPKMTSPSSEVPAKSRARKSKG